MCRKCVGGLPEDAAYSSKTTNFVSQNCLRAITNNRHAVIFVNHARAFTKHTHTHIMYGSEQSVARQKRDKDPYRDG